MALIKIQHDTFNISQRIKEIDEGYFIVYNTSCGRFEIHNSKQHSCTFCLTVDGELNSKVVEKVRKTRVQNVKKLLEEMEQNNLMLEKESQRKFDDEMKFKLGETFDYLKSHDDLTGAYGTRFV